MKTKRIEPKKWRCEALSVTKGDQCWLEVTSMEVLLDEVEKSIRIANEICDRKLSDVLSNTVSCLAVEEPLSVKKLISEKVLCLPKTISCPPSQVVDLVVEYHPDVYSANCITKPFGNVNPDFAITDNHSSRLKKLYNSAPCMTKFLEAFGLEIVKERTNPDLLAAKYSSECAENIGTVKQISSQVLQLRKLENEPFKFRQHICKSCFFKTDSNTIFAFHKQLLHVIRNKYQCGFCLRYYATENTITRHYLQKHGMIPHGRGNVLVDPCFGCGQEFLRECMLEEHTRICCRYINQSHSLQEPLDLCAINQLMWPQSHDPEILYQEQVALRLQKEKTRHEEQQQLLKENLLVAQRMFLWEQEKATLILQQRSPTLNHLRHKQANKEDANFVMPFIAMSEGVQIRAADDSMPISVARVSIPLITKDVGLPCIGPDAASVGQSTLSVQNDFVVAVDSGVQQNSPYQYQTVLAIQHMNNTCGPKLRTPRVENFKNLVETESHGFETVKQFLTCTAVRCCAFDSMKLMCKMERGSFPKFHHKFMEKGKRRRLLVVMPEDAPSTSSYNSGEWSISIENCQELEADSPRCQHSVGESIIDVIGASKEQYVSMKKNSLGKNQGSPRSERCQKKPGNERVAKKYTSWNKMENPPSNTLNLRLESGNNVEDVTRDYTVSRKTKKPRAKAAKPVDSNVLSSYVLNIIKACKEHSQGDGDYSRTQLSMDPLESDENKRSTDPLYASNDLTMNSDNTENTGVTLQAVDVDDSIKSECLSNDVKTLDKNNFNRKRLAVEYYEKHQDEKNTKSCAPNAMANISSSPSSSSPEVSTRNCDTQSAREANVGRTRRCLHREKHKIDVSERTTNCEERLGADWLNLAKCIEDNNPLIESRNLLRASLCPISNSLPCSKSSRIERDRTCVAINSNISPSTNAILIRAKDAHGRLPSEADNPFVSEGIRDPVVERKRKLVADKLHRLLEGKRMKMNSVQSDVLSLSPNIADQHGTLK